MDEKVTKAFNEWMRRFIEAPDQFAREFQEVQSFLKQSAEGVEPSYGSSCAAYLNRLLAEVA